MDRFKGKTARPSPLSPRRRPWNIRSLSSPAASLRCSDASPAKKRVLTAAGVEAAQAPLSGHHQLTVGLLHSASN